MSKLNGPYPLNQFGVDLNVLPFGIGGYALGHMRSDGKMEVRYVGRSCDALNSRLKDHVREGKYTAFGYQPCVTDNDCYLLECELYHEFGAEALDNEIHPAGIDFLDVCPYCGR
ncbi:MAG: hypothetical protein ABL889_19980 [Terricaulis sp.]